MKVLSIGGSGIISSACSELAGNQGLELYLLNRGQSTRPVPAGVRLLQGDIRDRASATKALGEMTFDAVVDWVAFTPQHVEADPARQLVNQDLDKLMDEIIAAQESARP